MSTNLVRMRYAAVAVEIESTAGTDVIATTPTAAQFIGADCEVSIDQDQVQNPELTGSLDRAVPIVGALRPTLRIRMPLRGSGTAATAPEFGKLLRACTMAQTITSTAIGVPTAATAGTTTSVTLATPAAATAQLYRGMPLVLTGVGAAIAGITDYTAARVATLGLTLSTAATTGTNFQIPAHVLYGPSSDETAYKTLTVYMFRDGLRWRFTGAMGTWSIEITSGGLAFLTFDLMAQLVSAPDATALPAVALGAVRQTPPRFVGGKLQLNRLGAQARTLTVNAGVSTVLPDDPEAAEGYGPALAVERAITGNLDPLMNTTLSVARFTAFQAGTNVSLMAIIGSTAGNRFLLTLPAIRTTQNNPTARDQLGVDSIAFQADGADAGVYLAAF